MRDAVHRDQTGSAAGQGAALPGMRTRLSSKGIRGLAKVLPCSATTRARSGIKRHSGSRVTSHRQVRDIDAQIGQRIMEARQAQDMTQERLADALGISFQQVQKYEKAANRVSAGRLFDIAHVLGRPITYFFEGAEPFVTAVQRRKARAGVKNR